MFSHDIFPIQSPTYGKGKHQSKGKGPKKNLFDLPKSNAPLAKIPPPPPPLASGPMTQRQLQNTGKVFDNFANGDMLNVEDALKPAMEACGYFPDTIQLQKLVQALPGASCFELNFGEFTQVAAWYHEYSLSPVTTSPRSPPTTSCITSPLSPKPSSYSPPKADIFAGI